MIYSYMFLFMYKSQFMLHDFQNNFWWLNVSVKLNNDHNQIISNYHKKLLFCTFHKSYNSWRKTIQRRLEKKTSVEIVLRIVWVIAKISNSSTKQIVAEWFLYENFLCWCIVIIILVSSFAYRVQIVKMFCGSVNTSNINILLENFQE